VRDADQELRIERSTSSVNDVFLFERIHVMYEQLSMDIVTRYSEIARIISNDDVSANTAPLSRRVELLIDPPIETESGLTNFTS
jgi:hypothetical protein